MEVGNLKFSPRDLGVSPEAVAVLGLSAEAIAAATNDMALTCILELQEREARLGIKYSAEERALILHTRGAKAALDWMNARLAEQQQRQDTADAAAATQASAQTQAEAAPVDVRAPLRTLFGELVDLWRAHPFLFGWFGAGLLDKMKGRE